MTIYICAGFQHYSVATQIQCLEFGLEKRISVQLQKLLALLYVKFIMFKVIPSVS